MTDSPRSSSSTSSRREFLKTSAAGVAAVSGLSLARSAHAAGGEAIKIGMLGCGGRCSGAAAQALSLGKDVKLAGMADVFEKRMRGRQDWFKANYPDQFTATDETCAFGLDGYKKVIEASDAVLIACASKYHAFYAEEAVKAGKHVFCVQIAHRSGKFIRFHAKGIVRLPTGDAAKEDFVIAFKTGKRLVCHACDNYFFVWVYIRADGRDIFIGQNLDTRAIEPEKFTICTVSIAMTVRIFVPAVFGKPIVLADLVHPNHLPVIHARREIIGNVILHPRRRNRTFQGQVNIRDGHFSPEACLTCRHCCDGRIRKVSGWLYARRPDITLGSLQIFLVGQRRHIPKDLTFPGD